MWQIKTVRNTDLFVSHILYNNKLKKTVRGVGRSGRWRAQWKQLWRLGSCRKFVDLWWSLCESDGCSGLSIYDNSVVYVSLLVLWGQIQLTLVNELLEQWNEVGIYLCPAEACCPSLSEHKRSCYLKSITFHSTKQLLQGQSDGERAQISQLVMTSFGIRMAILSHWVVPFLSTH